MDTEADLDQSGIQTTKCHRSLRDDPSRNACPILRQCCNSSWLYATYISPSRFWRTAKATMPPAKPMSQPHTRLSDQVYFAPPFSMATKRHTRLIMNKVAPGRSRESNFCRSGNIEAGRRGSLKNNNPAMIRRTPIADPGQFGDGLCWQLYLRTFIQKQNLQVRELSVNTPPSGGPTTEAIPFML